MKIQTPTEFLTFNDGFCDIYTTKNNKLDKRVLHLRFGDRVVGFKRHFAARAANTRATRLIQVPLQQQHEITAADRAVIEKAEYRVEQIQPLKDRNPPVSVLTLERTR